MSAKGKRLTAIVEAIEDYGVACTLTGYEARGLRKNEPLPPVLKARERERLLVAVRKIERALAASRREGSQP